MKETDQGVKWFNTIYYPTNRTFRAVLYEEKILPRLREEKITLFTPWGPRYDFTERGTHVRDGDKEVEVLRFLSNIISSWREQMPGKEFSWIFLGADLYGTRINGLGAEAVSNYFESLRFWLSRLIPKATFRLWSDFDTEAEDYRRKIASNFGQYADCDLLERAEKTAKGMNRGSSAREYLVERFAEALLIEEKFRPIKISCVNRSKDTTVDLDLPRLYFLPERLLAPWM